MKNPFPNAPRKQNMSNLVPPGCSSDNTEKAIRSPGEFSGDEVVKEWQQFQNALIKEEELIQKQLSDLTGRTGMPITQENGQRRYGPPFENMEPPPRGSEVFIGRLPRDCYEPELVPVLESVGRIYELRLMMNFSGNNRGYCFVQYCTPDEAAKAILKLNNYEIRKGYKIGVTKSVDNCRLFIGKIPRDKSAEEIKEEVDKLVDGVVKVHVKPPRGATEEIKNPGYAFIQLVSHRAAAMARRKLIAGQLKLWGEDFAVDWADPEREPCEVIVQNLSPHTTEESLWQIFSSVTNNGVSKINKRGTLAYVSFASSQQALIAKYALGQQWIDGQQVNVDFTRYSKASPSTSPKKDNSKGKLDYKNQRSPTMRLKFQNVNGCTNGNNQNIKAPPTYRQQSQVNNSLAAAPPPLTPWNFGMILKNGEFTRVDPWYSCNQPARQTFGYEGSASSITFNQSSPPQVFPIHVYGNATFDKEYGCSSLPLSSLASPALSTSSGNSLPDPCNCVLVDNFQQQFVLSPFTPCY